MMCSAPAGVFDVTLVTNFDGKTPAALTTAIQSMYGRRAVCVSISLVPTTSTDTYTPIGEDRGGGMKGGREEGGGGTT